MAEHKSSLDSGEHGNWDIQGATFAFKYPVAKLSEVVCRCRHCKRNDVPAVDMAMLRWQEAFGIWAGVCRQCFLKDDYEETMLDSGES